MKKKFLIVLGIVLFTITLIIYILWNKPHRDISREKGINITSEHLTMAYEHNQSLANENYLDKVLNISGTVVDVSTNQEDNKVIILDNILSGVQCTMKDKNVVVNIGEVISIKGVCNGYTIGVMLSDCILIE